MNIFSNETISIEINKGLVILMDYEALTYKFPSVDDAVQWCQRLIETGNGEWWIAEIKEALLFLEAC